MRPLWRAPEPALAVWGFALNGVWELAQSPLYTDHSRGAAYVIWNRLHCTGGDVLILLAAFWLTSLLFRSRRWWAEPRGPAAATFLLLGFAYTVWSEWRNTQPPAAWQYTSAMPLAFGLGLAPLLQWLLVPPLVLVLMGMINFRAAPKG